MKQLVALVTCCTILYGIDVVLFNGWYMSGLKDAAQEVYVRW
jgi:hypothetical protein